MATKLSISQAKYDRTHCKRVSLKLHMENDADILETLSSVPSIQGYIKQAIRNYIKNADNKESEV